MNAFLDAIKKTNNDMNSAVVFDIDGVIVDFNNCPNRDKCDYTDYPKNLDKLYRLECKLNPNARFYLALIKKLGVRIVLLTSRVEAEREVTEKWLRMHDIQYDELVMGKPRGFMYVDDLGYTFTGNWGQIYKRIEKHVGKSEDIQVTDT